MLRGITYISNYSNNLRNDLKYPKVAHIKFKKQNMNNVIYLVTQERITMSTNYIVKS